jgi:hypothetical protein
MKDGRACLKMRPKRQRTGDAEFLCAPARVRCGMNRVAIVATHHKTGTVWMRNVFRGIAGALKVPFKYLKETSIPTDIGPPAICFSPHSAISPGDIQQYRSECRILHMIRDPRDVIVSAAHYHQTSDELWLHKKRRAFDGMTYQEKINSLADDRERYLFELRNSGNRTVKAMQRWNYSLPNAVECRYEDMIEDSEMTLFTRVA